MKITRFFTTPENGSRFQEIEICFPLSRNDDYGHTLLLSRNFLSDSVWVELPAHLNQGWHVAPNRQFVTVLTGRLEIETTDGEVRQWSAGGMFMADDTTGQGHKTRVIEGPVKILFSRVAQDFDLNALLQ